MNTNKMTYAGFHHDKHGVTMMGRVVLDSWLFGFIPETEDCAGWDLGRMQVLMEKVEAEWDKYGNVPSRLPDDLRARHTDIYARALKEARVRGWNPELGDDD
jgi:hypothetical protein